MSEFTGYPEAPAEQQLSAAGRHMSGRTKEAVIYGVLLTAASVSILTTVSIVVILLWETVNFFSRDEVTVADYLFSTEWSPKAPPKFRHFGIWPLASATGWIALGSGIIALPLGLLCAIYLSEYASRRFRDVIKPVLEILAGIPSVVYGYFAVVLISPLIKDVFPEAATFNAVSASIVVAVMILPTVVSLSEDVLRSVPKSLREAAHALGATKFQVVTRVVTPTALSGILASFLLAVSRAVGETMAVTLAAGNGPNLTANPLESMQTMTGYIARTSQGDTPHGSIEYHSIFAVCMSLFLITLTMNIAAQWVLARFSARYE